jgi:hypothetical protein
LKREAEPRSQGAVTALSVSERSWRVSTADTIQ